MTTKELKQQAREEFDDRFGRQRFAYDSLKAFLDSIIDRAVEHEQERIVEFLDQQKAKLDNCNNVDGRVQSECFKRNHRAEDWNEVIRRITSLITNNSDINNINK